MSKIIIDDIPPWWHWLTIWPVIAIILDITVLGVVDLVFGSQLQFSIALWIIFYGVPYVAGSAPIVIAFIALMKFINNWRHNFEIERAGDDRFFYLFRVLRFVWINTAPWALFIGGIYTFWLFLSWYLEKGVGYITTILKSF